MKLALDSEELNKAVSKNKYQMPNIENLMDRQAEIIKSIKPGNVRFTSIDLRYAYGPLMLHIETAKQCNFSVVGGLAEGTYSFKTGF